MPITIGNLAAMGILLGGGVLICQPDRSYEPAAELSPQEQFLSCSMHCDYAGMERALALGARVDGRAFNGMTALMIAASEGNLPMVRRLLEKGADVNIPLPDGNSVLAVAIEGMGDAETIRTLVEAGARKEPADETADRLTAYP